MRGGQAGKEKRQHIINNQIDPETIDKHAQISSLCFLYSFVNLINKTPAKSKSSPNGFAV
jgi:hypothetical protein